MNAIVARVGRTRDYGASLQRALLTPWLATRKAQHWGAGVTYVGALVGVALWLVLADGAHAWMAIRVLTACMLLVSTVFLSFGAALARAASQSGWPGVRRSAALGAWIYALVGIAVPGLVIGALEPGLAALTVAMCTFGLSMGLIYMLAPRKYRGSGIITIILLLNPGLNFAAGLSAPWLAAVVAALALLVTALAVGIWQRMVRRASWDCPLALSRASQTAHRTRGRWRERGWSAWNAIIGALFRSSWNVRDYLRAQVDLARTGPRWPVRSMRVALGGFDLLFSRGARVAWAVWLGAAAVFVAVILGVVNIYVPYHAAQVANRVIGICAIMLAELVCLGSVLTTIGRNWHREGDLAVLALLPGFGAPARARRNLLRAILGTPLSIQAACWIGMLLVAAWLQLDWHTEVLMTMIALACATYTANTVLRRLGSERHRIAWVCAMLAGSLLLIVSMILSVSTYPNAHTDRAVAITSIVIVLWALCCLVLAWTGWRSWRRLQRRPHPFLPPLQPHPPTLSL